MTKLQQFVKKILNISLYIYVIGFMVYLVLRLIFEDRVWWLSFINSFSLYLFFPLLLILPIAFILKQKLLVVITTILLVIGLFWISPYFLPKAHAVDKAGVTIRIVTFNIWGNNKRLNDVEKFLRDTNADIVVMQEIPNSYADNQVANLKDIYPHQLIQWTWGSLILSRYPFLDSGELTAHTGSTDQRVVINVGGEDIAIYNIHLPCPPCNKPRFEFPGPWFINMPLAYDDSQRNEVIQKLVNFLDKETLPYIVAGDFNTSAQSPTYSVIAHRAKDVFLNAGTGLGFSWPVDHEVSGFPAFVPPLIRIDYIWYSDHFEAIEAQQGPTLGSDHLPLWATLKLKSSNP